MNIYPEMMVVKWIVFGLLLYCVLARTIQTPTIISQQKVYLRLKDNKQLEEPQLTDRLKQISKMEALVVVQNKQVPFSVCSELPPYAQFDIYRQLFLHFNHETEFVVSNFSKIQNPRFLIDAAFDGKYLIYLLSNGTIGLHQIFLFNFNSVPQAVSQSISGSVQDAQILAIDSNFVILTRQKAYLIDTKTFFITVLTNYLPKDQLVSAISLSSNSFVTVHGRQGLVIYTLNSSQLVVQSTLTLKDTSFKSFKPIDISFDSKNKRLFVLDQDTGLLIYQLKDGGKQLSFKNKIVRRQECNVVHFDQQNEQLYLSCDELYKIRFDDHLGYTQKVMSHPQITIRDIAGTGQQVALVGRNTFQMLLQDRLLSILADRQVKKLFLHDRKFISVSESKILMGNYTVTPPSISCYNEDAGLEGSFKVLLKITAACDEAYLKQINFTFEKGDNDHCVYPVYKDLILWTPNTSYQMPLIITSVLIGVIAAVVGGFCLYYKRKIAHFNTELNKYVEFADTSERNKYEELNEEKVVEGGEEEKKQYQLGSMEIMKKVEKEKTPQNQKNKEKVMHSIE